MVQLARAIRELTRTREVNDVEQPNPQLAIEPPVEMRRDPPHYAPPPKAVQSQTLQRPPLPLRNNVDFVTVELILTSALAEKGNKLAAAKSALYPSESEDDSG